MFNDVENNGEYEAPLFEEMGDFQQETGWFVVVPSNDLLAPGLI
jgi:hypothetical protein